MLSKKFLFFFFILFGIYACSEQNTDEPVAKEEVSVINPNGDSELALLMRKMYEDADKIKNSVISGDRIDAIKYIDDLKRIHVASPTDPNVKTAEFKAFTQLMISAAEEFSTQKEKDKAITSFNNLVQKCVDCHQTVCPGPIKRIQKLTIK